MKTPSLIVVLAMSVAIVACQKRQTEEERRADVDREVQARLAAEHQQQQAQDLAQREADVNAREQALAAQQATAQPTPQATHEPETTNETQPAGNSYSMFYNKLEPYGDWIETDNYGYVFRPRQAENGRWRPYTDGQWVYTDAGWTWVSDEPFGWATYHYGRWTRLRGVGWVWVPGNEWASAWVSWRTGGQYVGWAPLPPEAHFERGSGIHTWSDSRYDVGPDQYVFIPATDIGEQQVARAIVPEQQNVTIVNQTTNVTDITYNNTSVVNQGPNYEQLRAQSRAPIPRLKLERQTVVPAQGAHAEVRSDTVIIPAPPIAPAQTQDKPRAVKQTVRQAAVERGWGAMNNQQAEQTRAKIKSEATPPPNAPPKTFAKPPTAAPMSTATIPAATATPQATLAVTPVVSPHAPAATAVATAVNTPATRPFRTAPEGRSPAPSVPPSAPNHPRTSPAISRLEMTPSPAATSTPVSTPAAPHSPAAAVPPNVRHAPPPHHSPLPEPSASVAVSPEPSSPAEHERGEKRRRLPPQKKPAETSPSPTATP